MRDEDRWKSQIATVAEALSRNVKRLKLLEVLAWPEHVEKAFFARNASALPEVRYDVDRNEIQARIASLAELQKSIDGDDDVAQWLRNTLQSFIDGNRMALALGTAEFYRLNCDVYGGAHTQFGTGTLRNVDLADHLFRRLEVHGWDEARDPDVTPLTAGEFADALRGRIAARSPALELSVDITDDMAAKVVAGMRRVRVRSDATFMPWEVNNLWVHEVETHSLSAVNGSLQPLAPFLSAGGPRATRTQEGLATFTELYHHELSTERLRRLATRVRLVEMAENGASFLDLYRHLIDVGSTPQNAYFDAQRVCRGGLVEGGAPCTKDVVYLSGLLDVWSFLLAVIREGHRDEAELLVCGRMSLDDLPALIVLRHCGLLARPTYLPAWLSNWRTLLPHFAFTSFATELDLASIEARYAKIITVSGQQRAPDGCSSRVD